MIRKIEQVAFGLSWEADGQTWSIDYKPVKIDLKKPPIQTEYTYNIYEVYVIFRLDGSLDFQSGTGNVTRTEPTPDNPTGFKSTILTREQWLTSENLISEALERAYKSPHIVHKSVYFTPGESSNSR